MATSARRIQNSEGATVREVSRPAWSPAQIVAIIAGLFLVVVGAVALGHTGFRFTNIPYTRTVLLGLPVTSLSASAELIAGVLVLAGAGAPSAAKVVTSVLGVTILAWGLIVAFDPAPFGRLWGYDRGNGILYVVIGAILLVTAAVSPVFMSRREVLVSESSAQAEEARTPY